MTTVVKMVGKHVENMKDIRAYIKFRTKLGHSADLYLIWESNGSHKTSYETVRRWRKKIHTVKDTTQSGRTVTATGNTNVREVIETDGRYTIRYIAKAVCISLSRVHVILKRILKVNKRFLPEGDFLC